MSKQQSSWATPLLFASCALVSTILLIGGGCSDRSGRPQSTAGIAKRKTNDAEFLISTVSDSLNNLPREVVLELTPPKPILDDAKSADGKPVMAICTPTPAVPDGPINFISIPKGNGNFRKIRVKPGDIVRYFAKYDKDSFEHGYQQADFFRFKVRRLDTYNPDNALIVEGSLNFPQLEPQRIEIWHFSDKRTTEIDNRIKRYEDGARPKIGWEPSADETALEELVERANQWLRNLGDQETPWNAEKKIFQLPEKLRKSKRLIQLLAPKQLEFGQFNDHESRQLQQAIWFRDVSRWAKGEAISPVDVASELFDWTIRNIQLEADNAQLGHVHQPWQVLMYGRGTAKQRAWVFAELCRQQQLDIVMLASGDSWWLSALVDDKKIYLYDTRLGLPIPGNNSETVATLAEVLEDPELLRQLDFEENRYPTTAEELRDLTAWLVASPLQLAKRARLLEESLEGDDYVVLSAGTNRIAETVSQATGIENVQLWPFTFESILNEASLGDLQRKRASEFFRVFAEIPQLWKARVLHFQGTKDIPIGDRNDPLAQPELGHQQAIALYQTQRVRLSDRVIQRLIRAKQTLYGLSKANASYWVGLLSYDLGRYRVAKDWFEKRTLEAIPNGPWTHGARYNLARTYEAMGDLPTAIKLLEADNSPQRIGNLLRARQLKSGLETTADTSETDTTDSETSEE